MTWDEEFKHRRWTAFDDGHATACKSATSLWILRRTLTYFTTFVIKARPKQNRLFLASICHYLQLSCNSSTSQGEKVTWFNFVLQFPASYAAITETHQPAELIPQFTTLEYQIPTAHCIGPVFLFVLDTCMDDEDLQVWSETSLSVVLLIVLQNHLDKYPADYQQCIS